MASPLSTRCQFKARHLLPCLLLALGELWLSAGSPSTAFTYQGRLFDGGAPANGLYDLQFTNYDAASGGNALGAFSANAVPVSNGLFTVSLDFGAAFDGSLRWLEVSERASGAAAFTTLWPRQPLTAAPYAVFAGGVNAAGITGTIPAASIGNGTITSNMLAPGAAAANLAASGQSTTPSGGMALSANYNDGNLMNAGYVRLAPFSMGEAWQQCASGSSPATRDLHAAVWTGSEMIVWGGWGASGDLGDGARYNPAANSWTALSATGAPSARRVHTAVWTGSEMIVWGGASGMPATVQYNGDGGRYNPAADTWTAVSTTGAPSGRANQTAVWTGSLMIVWGGEGSGGLLNDGGRYQPASDSWMPVTTSAGPSWRDNHTAVWTGSEMIVWGGWGGWGPLTSLNDGGSYNPTSDSWTAASTTGAPSARVEHTAVWTGTQMIVWGGTATPSGSGSFFNDGGCYNRGADSWTPVQTINAPAARTLHTAVWTGSEMLVWGGAGGASPTFTQYTDGGRYNPSTNAWLPLPTAGAPAARLHETAVWTGSEMIVWGGIGSGGVLNDGGRFNAAANSWTALRGAPSAREFFTATWTGTEMIVWGGSVEGKDPNTGEGKTFPFNDGARFNPTANSWTPMNPQGAPAARLDHAAVWTGTEMIVWGGNGYNDNVSTCLNDGGRYNPAADSWTPVSTTGAPLARDSHTAVWTGTEMIVWGGENPALAPLTDGGRYNPAVDHWTAVTTTGAPAARVYHTAVWTGAEMIVWGGDDPASFEYVTGGGRYNPAADSWAAVPTTGAPSVRDRHTAVWTGTEMIVWGGNYAGAATQDGGRYSPGANSWKAVTTTGAPARRAGHTAVWTGTEMIIWGGIGSLYDQVLGWQEACWNDGGRYNPAGDGWTAMTTTGAPSPRENHGAVWTGSAMIVWGGFCSTAPSPLPAPPQGDFNDTYSYSPSRSLWLYQRP